MSRKEIHAGAFYNIMLRAMEGQWSHEKIELEMEMAKRQIDLHFDGPFWPDEA